MVVEGVGSMPRRPTRSEEHERTDGDVACLNNRPGPSAAGVARHLHDRPTAPRRTRWIVSQAVGRHTDDAHHRERQSDGGLDPQHPPNVLLRRRSRTSTPFTIAPAAAPARTSATGRPALGAGALPSRSTTTSPTARSWCGRTSATSTPSTPRRSPTHPPTHPPMERIRRTWRTASRRQASDSPPTSRGSPVRVRDRPSRAFLRTWFLPLTRRSDSDDAWLRVFE
jgi:hypothetical protein